MHLRNLFLVLALAVSGCSTVSGPKYSETPALLSSDKATIVVYRWSSMKGMAWQHPIHVDGKHVANLGSGNFTRFLVDPGHHRVSLGTKAPDLVVNLKAVAGMTYFIEDYPGPALLYPGHFSIVDPSKAEKRVASYKYQSPLTQ